MQAVRRVAEFRHGARQQRVDRERRQRRPVRRLPDHRIAAHQRQRRVPGPDRDRKIEGGDHADRADRMPLLHQPVLGALADDGEAVELPRQAEREVADVDHLLDLALALGEDLAGLEGDQPAEVALGAAKLVAEQAHELAAPRRRHAAPLLERGLRGADRLRAPARCSSARSGRSTSPVIGERTQSPPRLVKRDLAAEGAKNRARFRAHGWRCEVSWHDRPFATVTADGAPAAWAMRTIRSGACSIRLGRRPATTQRPPARPRASLAGILNLHYHRVQETPHQGKPALHDIREGEQIWYRCACSGRFGRAPPVSVRACRPVPVGTLDGAPSSGG